jgi:riboflavin kinase/FMN adenylyltransferase
VIVHFGTDLVEAGWKGSTVCIGVFDGVHLGHQAVIAAAVRAARVNDHPCVLVTFDRHPASTLAPDRVPLALSSLGQNLDLFEALGVAVTVVLAFDQATASTSAEDFLGMTLKDRLKAERLVIGHDFAFGRGRQGDGAWLSQRIKTIVVPPLEMEGHRVSSTEIRGLVSTGEVERARRFLGRPFALHGIVVEGERRGRELGFPTLNIALSSRLAVPSDGVYGGWCQTSQGRYRAATGIGCRPTFGGKQRTVEAFLLDYPGDELYGEAVDLGFSVRIRGDEHFSDAKALVSQMEKDVFQVRTIVE